MIPAELPEATILDIRFQARVSRALFCALIAVGVFAVDVHAQSSDQTPPEGLFAGDSIRVNGSVVGRVLSVDGSVFTLMSRGKPVCRAGEMHGDAPICDPAPMRRETLAFDDVTIERRMTKGNPNAWLLGGALLGGAAFAGLGYVIGPSVGFGKVDACTADETQTFCDNPVSREEVDAQQEARDQRRGAFFFGLMGGTFTAIMAKKLSTGWVQIHPTLPVDDEDGWGMTFTLPSN